MKINRFLFKNNQISLEEDIDFSNAELDQNHIRKIESCHVKISGHEYEDLLILNVEVKADIIGVCSYTLEDVPIHLNFKDSLEFSNEVEDDEELFYVAEPIFDIDPYILGLIIAETPMKIVKNGAKLPSGGKDFRVLSEEEYLEEKKQKTDSRWSKLDDIELE